MTYVSDLSYDREYITSYLHPGVSYCWCCGYSIIGDIANFGHRSCRIHRKVLRIFKIVKANQSQLKLLKTYIYKNILMFLSDFPGRTWTDNDIADRWVKRGIQIFKSKSDRGLWANLEQVCCLCSGGRILQYPFPTTEGTIFCRSRPNRSRRTTEIQTLNKIRRFGI